MFSSSVQEYGLHSSDTVSRAKLGTKVETDDGRVFRYCFNSTAALVAGNVIQAAPVLDNHSNLAVTATAVGAKSVTVTLGGTAVAANDYADGYLVVNDVDGEGHTYKIAGNPAQASTTGTVAIALEDPIKVALTANSQVTLIPNPFFKPVIGASAQTGTAVGVAPFALAASAFGWLQSKGVASVLADEAITAGKALVMGDSTAGSVSTLNAAGEAQIGVALQAGVDTEFRPVMLSID